MFLCLVVILSAAHADFFRSSLRSGLRRGRQGRQEAGGVTGGVDFTGCEEDPDTGLCCVEKIEQVTTLQKDPILECTHKNVEQCHYTYVTQFTPSQEEVSVTL